MHNKQEFKDTIVHATGCCEQHTGWPCGSCFFTISDKLTNRDWQTVLWYRGDYREEDLDNLPKEEERQKVLDFIYYTANAKLSENR